MSDEILRTPDEWLKLLRPGWAIADADALLHEIGGVIEEETFRTRISNVTMVRLIMTGDELRRVRVLIGPYADVEWEVIRVRWPGLLRQSTEEV